MKSWVKSATYGGLAVLALLAIGIALAIGGCREVLYPLARAFGSPPEEDLAVCRVAFAELKKNLPASSVRVEPVQYAATRDTRRWRYDWAEGLAREAHLRMPTRYEIAPIAPGVVPTHFGRNQMRYLWERAVAYSNWLKSSPPGIDYIWCTEIFAQEGRVIAIQVFVYDAKGQLAYCRLFNSHHFGKTLNEGDDALRLVVQTLLDDLKRDPEQIFPRYGVG
ncbi:MAG TPA: hypothetical protein PLU52_08585 [Opitutaceae bacterium]|nr:hypothetical protein [Opitutaceae bacterium]HND62660.1 hypothetical protein [Opitutaceae bacterium]